MGTEEIKEAIIGEAVVKDLEETSIVDMPDFKEEIKAELKAEMKEENRLAVILQKESEIKAFIENIDKNETMSKTEKRMLTARNNHSLLQFEAMKESEDKIKEISEMLSKDPIQVTTINLSSGNGGGVTEAIVPTDKIGEMNEEILSISADYWESEVEKIKSIG